MSGNTPRSEQLAALANRRNTEAGQLKKTDAIDETTIKQHEERLMRDAMVNAPRLNEEADDPIAELPKPNKNIEDDSKLDDDGGLRDGNGHRIYGVYISATEHSQQLALYDRDGNPIFIPFSNHTLIVRDEYIWQQIEDNMKKNPAYPTQIIRAGYKEALMLIDIAERSQKEAASVGAMSAPFVRAAESLRAGNIALLKQGIVDNGMGVNDAAANSGI